ncbi:MAG: hypothetical protein RhofKO_10670 [Rhodothermales bacterium]
MQSLLLTSLEDAAETLAPCIAEKLRPEFVDAIRQATMPPLLTKQKLMDLTGWSSRQVEYKKAQGEIPYIRRGRLVLFPTDEIMAYLREGYVPARTAA